MVMWVWVMLLLSLQRYTVAALNMHQKEPTTVQLKKYPSVSEETPAVIKLASQAFWWRKSSEKGSSSRPKARMSPF